MSNTTVVAIIPARSGSKSVKNKNIADLGGYPLISYSIIAAKMSKYIERIIVSTDSEHYAQIAVRYGAEVPFIRPKKLATDQSTDREFILHAMEWFDENEKIVPEYWVQLRPTTPLRDPLIVDEAIKQIKSQPNATSLRSGYPCPESPFKWFRRNSEGYFKSLSVDSAEISNLPKEAFETVYIPDGYVDVIKSSHVQNNDTLHGEKMIGFISPVCSEVDSVEEFEYIKYTLQTKGSMILDYLKKNYKKEH